MALRSRSYVSENRSSADCGRSLGTRIRSDLGDDVKLVIVYLTVNHDQPALLRGLREVLGGDVAIVGCSGQGVIARGFVREEGYAASALALGGDSLACATGAVEDLAHDTRAKGRALAAELRAQLTAPPSAVVVHYDPIVGANMDEFLAGFHAELDCLVVGGGAGHNIGVANVRTFQYVGDRVLSGGASAVALGGALTITHASSLGCSPVGLEMTVTRADANVLLALDGRPALEVWQEITHVTPGQMSPNETAGLAIGLPAYGGYLVRAAFQLDVARGGVVLQAEIPTGTRVMLFHRTIEDVLEGTRRAVRELAGRLAGKHVRAALLFECGARTTSFLGDEATLAENVELQHALGPDADYAGVVVWGELFPVGGRPAFHNYTYPMLVIAEP